jgi:hypothetical protein
MAFFSYTPGGKEILVPYHDDLIISIDSRKKTIVLVFLKALRISIKGCGKPAQYLFDELNTFREAFREDLLSG